MLIWSANLITFDPRDRGYISHILRIPIKQHEKKTLWVDVQNSHVSFHLQISNNLPLNRLPSPVSRKALLHLM